MATPTKGGNVPPGQEKKIEGTIMPVAPFNKAADVATLQSALGTSKNEKELTDLLTRRSSQQRQAIRDTYKEVTGRDLMTDIEAQVANGDFKKVVIALVDGGLEFAARCLNQAMQGMGTDEKALVDVLCTRNRNVEIQAIKETYVEMYSCEFVPLIKEETSEPFTSLLLTMAQGQREETPSNSNIEVQARQDANALFMAGEGRKRGPRDDKKFIEVLGTRSLVQLNLATFKAYDKLSKKGGIEKAIEAEKCGDVEDGYMALVKTAKNELIQFFTDRLYKAMKGVGTDENALIRILVSRSEIDLANIKDEFKTKYGVSLIDYIKDDTSGEFCNILVRILEGSMPIR